MKKKSALGFTLIRTLAHAKNLDKIQPYSGFTLIELLVTISLIAVLFTIGITSYIDFSRRQTVFQAARKIVQDLRLAQSLAANNQKPQLPDQTPDPSCATLDGYTFRIPNLTYEIDVNCSGPVYTNKIKEDSIPPGLTLNGFVQVKFKVLRQTLECSPCDLTITGFGKSKKIIVGSGGAINIEGE